MANGDRTFVIKVGTNVITQDSGHLNTKIMRVIAAQVAGLMRAGLRVVLVSSGAMGAGQGFVEPSKKLGRVSQRQVLAAVGQVHLIETYAKYFAVEGITAAQVLATKDDFRERHHYLNMRTCFEALLTEGIVPIVNENDVVSIDELMFTDNDELAGLIATMVNADALVLLTNVDGVFDGDPDDPGTEVIPEITEESSHWKHGIHPKKSKFGRGGMLTKCHTAQKLCKLGVTTHICNGMNDHILLDLCEGKQVGTTFPAVTCRVSGKKRWVAGGVSRAKGVVTINEGCANAILSKDNVASLLPIGITAIDGEFEKGDIIRIQTEQKKDLGLGVAAYGIEKAEEYMGKKGKKPLIHYDHLYLS